jgi:1-deoxy-D-xylulose-5-phosphate reductoisomerase
LAEIGRLDFEEPDNERFPSLELARLAGEKSGTLPAVFNAANEVAVEAFCNQEIKFIAITKIVSDTMDAHELADLPTLGKILEADSWARKTARNLVLSL